MPLTPALSQSTSREQLNPRVREREPSGVVDEPVLLRKVGRGWVCPYRFRTLEVSRKMKYYTERSASSIGSLSLWESVRVRGHYQASTRQMINTVPCRSPCHIPGKILPAPARTAFAAVIQLFCRAQPNRK